MALMTVKAVAETLRVTVQTIYRLNKRGELPFVKVGNSTRISEEDLRAYLSAHAQPNSLLSAIRKSIGFTEA